MNRWSILFFLALAMSAVVAGFVLVLAVLSAHLSTKSADKIHLRRYFDVKQIFY
jgi:hypothetical protein